MKIRHKLVNFADINECLVDNGGCDHTCQNYDGGRYCSCRSGYRLATDGKTCEGLYQIYLTILF